MESVSRASSDYPSVSRGRIGLTVSQDVTLAVGERASLSGLHELKLDRIFKTVGDEDVKECE